MANVEEDRDRGSQVKTDMEQFGKFIWEAAKKFSFTKLQVNDSVLGSGSVILQFGLMYKGQSVIHTEMITLKEVELLNDPKTVIDAIYSKAIQRHAMKEHANLR